MSLNNGNDTLILLSWGIAGAPLTAGTVTSQTPKPFFVIGWAVTSQLSASFSIAFSGSFLHAVRRTEFSDQLCLHSIWSPFSVYNVTIGLNVEAKPLVTLKVDEVIISRDALQSQMGPF